MPELLGWWVYVVGAPLSGGALLTLFSLGGSGKKSARQSRRAPKIAIKAAPKTPVQTVSKTAKTAAKAGKRQTKAAEFPPLFLAQNFLLLWSLVALCAVPFQPQNAAPLTLILILVAIFLLSIALLAICARLFEQFTPVDASSISHKSDLQGRVGECDATIGKSKGSILVRDEFGTLHHLAARCDEPIARGEAVLLIEYDGRGDFFLVRVWTETLPI
jgi:membrane protein implicated in regulation of membrane protease activity